MNPNGVAITSPPLQYCKPMPLIAARARMSGIRLSTSSAATGALLSLSPAEMRLLRRGGLNDAAAVVCRFHGIDAGCRLVASHADRAALRRASRSRKRSGVSRPFPECERQLDHD